MPRSVAFVSRMHWGGPSGARQALAMGSHPRLVGGLSAEPGSQQHCPGPPAGVGVAVNKRSKPPLLRQLEGR